jgi:predicted metal-dependent phosphotriesterase family hydrolase
MSTKPCTLMVPTVTGPQPATYLGVTLPHEHIIHRISNFSRKDDNTCVDIDLMSRELVLYRKAGGGTICDVTPIGVGRDACALREVSNRSGVTIVSGVGVYDVSTYPEQLVGASREKWADFLFAEVIGEGTGIQAGLIGEVASHNESHANWQEYRLFPIEEIVFRAVADVQKRTGLFISTHASLGRQGVAQLTILGDSGADLGRVIIGHCDAMAHANDLAKDMEYFHQLLNRGAWLEFDMFGWEELIPDELRFERVAALVKEGFVDRILLSMDICRRSQLCQNNGRGFLYFFSQVLPGLKRWGMSEAEIHRMTVENPARILGNSATAVTNDRLSMTESF